MDRTTATSTTSTSTTSTTIPRLTASVPYVVGTGEPAPEAKQLAVDVVQTIGSYPDGGGTREAASARIAAVRVEAAVVDQADALLGTGAAEVDVIYPQLGGLTTAEASVMVVARQRRLAGAEQSETVRVIDVRLKLVEGRWRVTAMASTGGEQTASNATPTEAANAVLSSSRIDLPDSARWDIEAGLVDDRILEILVRIAQTTPVSVTAFAAGHPINVFASESVSNHTKGRAVDIWALGGVPVVDQRSVGSPPHALLLRLLAEGVTELGGPWDVDGSGSRSFTNTVHQDHLHIGFDR